MNDHRVPLCIAFSVFALLLATQAPAQTAPEPIIDVHLHALPANPEGPHATYICAPYDEWPTWDARTGPNGYKDQVEGHPACAHVLRSPDTDDELMHRTLGIMKTRNIVGLASGPIEIVEKWRDADSQRIMAAVDFDPRSGTPTVDQLRELVKSKHAAAFAEIGTQYEGIAVNDQRMEPYYNLAEELDIPVGIHVGPGPPGISYWGMSTYRMRLSSMLLFEDVLVRHPKLRVWAMHAGWPLGDDAIATLYAHPQLYVDVAVIDYVLPKKEFYNYLQRLIDAGFEKRIMFGSDEMQWPDALSAAVDTIQNAPMLTPEQKRDILYNNAARFLRLAK